MTRGPNPWDNYEWMKNVFGVWYNRFDKFKSLRSNKELQSEYKEKAETEHNHSSVQ